MKHSDFGKELAASMQYFRCNFPVFVCFVNLAPCHHGMPHCQVADGGDDLQIKRAVANISNKPSWTANK
jgi:hypothetical protein